MEKHRFVLRTCGDNVECYKSVHHPIPTRENKEHSENFQNKSVSSTLKECRSIFCAWPN